MSTGNVAAWPPRAWRAALGATVIVGVAVVLGALILRAGAADPPRAEPLVWQDAAPTWAHDAAGWTSAPPRAPQPAADFTLSVSARWAADADVSAAWGVWLEQADGARVLFALAAGGYWTVRRCEAGAFPAEAVETCAAPRAEWRWLAHPRIKGAGAANTLTLTREPDGRVRLWLNGERLAALPVPWTGRWGVWTRGGALTWTDAQGRGAAFLGARTPVQDHAPDDQHQPPQPAQ